MDRSPPESSRPEGFFRCRDAGETLSRMKIRSSLILGVALQFGSITFAQDHKIEVTGDYSCIHANPQNNNLIPSFSLDGRGGSAAETHERREPKCSPASSGDMDTTDRFKPWPIASAISRSGTPSSATAL